MTQNNQSLSARIVRMGQMDAALSPEVLDALRLADLFEFIEPEEFFVPASTRLDTFRPLNANRMLARAG